jgi:hypothetical protein
MLASQPKPVQKARTSVSAEVFGKYNLKANFVPYVVPKFEDVKLK